MIQQPDCKKIEWDRDGKKYWVEENALNAKVKILISII